MSLANPASVSSDSWDYSGPAQRVGATARSRQDVKVAIPDDWDNEEEEEEEEPQKLWEAENKKAPMPELVISSSSTPASAIPPPVAAFQPSLRILKRPSPSPSPSSSSSLSDLQQKSYAEREAQYQAARERIFGGGASNTTSSSVKPRNATPPTSSSPTTPQGVPSVSVIRNPRGPDVSSESASRTPEPNGGGSRGFSARKGGNSSRRTMAVAQTPQSSSQG